MKTILIYLIHAFFLYFLVHLPLEDSSIKEILFFLVALLSIFIYYLDRATFLKNSFSVQIALSIAGGVFYGLVYYFYSDKSGWENGTFFLLILSMLVFLCYSIRSLKNNS